MTTVEDSRIAVVVHERHVRIVKVAYSIEELSNVTKEHPDALRRRIHNGSLIARNTGRRYLVTGPAAIAAGLLNASTLTNYHDVIDPDVHYTLKELGTFLDLSYWAAHRLLRAHRIAPVDESAARVRIRGAEILTYLGGRDDPMQHPESA